ncbi:hypothetical protein BDR06DRAFT_1015525 [Suillus hirtellus]|nr:hypothetical protein BDR06DRAFT_1015525 [Suillus hirtellus]
MSQGTFKDFQKPPAWRHFRGDPESGVSFRALIYIPSRLSEEFFNKPLDNSAKGVRLLVKHAFITSDHRRSSIESLSRNPPVQLFPQADQANYFTTSHPTLKLAASEDSKNRQKLAALVRFKTNQWEVVSFDSIFYLADMGKSIEHLSRSVFVEKLHARGGVPFQDVARLDRTLEVVNSHQRERLRYFHPHTDTPEEKDIIAELTDKYAPLLERLKIEAGDNVKNVIVSNRLVTSPCAIVADSMGFTANILKLMSATSRGAQQNDAMQDYMKKQKVIRDRHGDDKDLDSEAQLKEVASILIDGALVRSGFEVADSNLFLTRVDRVLRRSLGV